MEQTQPGTGPKRILLIDDDEGVRLSVGEILKRAGFSVQSATDGRKGLGMLRQGDFDLLITDLLMPEGDGLEAIMAMRRDRTATKILVISGCAQTLGGEYLKIAKHLGAGGILSKPFTRSELLAAVAKLLDVPAAPAPPAPSSEM